MLELDINFYTDFVTYFLFFHEFNDMPYQVKILFKKEILI